MIVLRRDIRIDIILQHFHFVISLVKKYILCARLILFNIRTKYKSTCACVTK